MATLKEIKTRISAIQNTKKITKTMEMVATAKSKKAVDRLGQSIIYSKKIKQLTLNVAFALQKLNHPLLKNVASPQKVGMLIFSGNRGLCGGFNNNIIKLAQRRIYELETQNIQCKIHLIGRKAVSTFNFLKIAFEKSFTDIEDKPSFQEVKKITDYFIDQFTISGIDQFEIISTRYMSSTSQITLVTPLLPFYVEDSCNDDVKKDSKEKYNFLFEPSSAEILKSLLPYSIRISVFQAFLESIASEQIARRIAMKNATENATEIIRDLTLVYNRARQARITQEIAELVGGAGAIN